MSTKTDIPNSQIHPLKKNLIPNVVPNVTQQNDQNIGTQVSYTYNSDHDDRHPIGSDIFDSMVENQSTYSPFDITYVPKEQTFVVKTVKIQAPHVSASVTKYIKDDLKPNQSIRQPNPVAAIAINMLRDYIKQHPKPKPLNITIIVSRTKKSDPQHTKSICHLNISNEFNISMSKLGGVTSRGGAQKQSHLQHENKFSPYILKKCLDSIEFITFMNRRHRVIRKNGDPYIMYKNKLMTIQEAFAMDQKEMFKMH